MKKLSLILTLITFLSTSFAQDLTESSVTIRARICFPTAPDSPDIFTQEEDIKVTVGSPLTEKIVFESRGGEYTFQLDVKSRAFKVGSNNPRVNLIAKIVNKLDKRIADNMNTYYDLGTNASQNMRDSGFCEEQAMITDTPFIEIGYAADYL